MSTVQDRILLFIQHKGISIRSFERQCNLSNGYISSMRKGLGGEKLNNVLREFPELNREWLLYGEGEMLKISNNIINGSGVVVSGDNNSSIDNRHYYSDSPDVLRAQIDILNDRIKEKDAQIKEKDAQIKEKDAQIKEKDAQINRLLTIITGLSGGGK